MKWYHSIRFRLMMIIGSLLIGTLLVVSGTSYYFARQYLSDSIDANAVHGSDAPETAAVEIAYFFPALNVYSR